MLASSRSAEDVGSDGEARERQVVRLRPERILDLHRISSTCTHGSSSGRVAVWECAAWVT